MRVLTDPRCTLEDSDLFCRTEPVSVWCQALIIVPSNFDAVRASKCVIARALPRLVSRCDRSSVCVTLRAAPVPCATWQPSSACSFNGYASAEGGMMSIRSVLSTQVHGLVLGRIAHRPV